MSRKLEVKVIASVCLSVRLFLLYLQNRPTSELEFYVRVRVITIAGLGLNIKVIGQGQRSISSVYWRGHFECRVRSFVGTDLVTTISNERLD